MTVEMTNAYGAWCDRDEPGDCDVLGPFAFREDAEDALKEHYKADHVEGESK